MWRIIADWLLSPNRLTETNITFFIFILNFGRICRHNCFVLRMGRKAVGPVCCVMYVKEPRSLIAKQKWLAPVFLDSRLEHPAGWICARYKSSVLLLVVLLLSVLLQDTSAATINDNLSTCHVKLEKLLLIYITMISIVVVSLFNRP